MEVGLHHAKDPDDVGVFEAAQSTDLSRQKFGEELFGRLSLVDNLDGNLKEKKRPVIKSFTVALDNTECKDAVNYV